MQGGGLIAPQHANLDSLLTRGRVRVRVRVGAQKEKKSATKVVVKEAEGHGTGWQFGNADAEGLKFGLWNALHTYKNYKQSWQKMMRRCMKTDFSWELSARKYEQVFEWAKMDGPFQAPWPFTN